MRVVEEDRPPEFFAGADEALISAASGILPIGWLDGRPLGSGKRPVYEALAAAYDEYVSERCGVKGGARG